MGRALPEARDRARKAKAAREARAHELRVAIRFRDSHRKVARCLERMGCYQRAAAEADRAAHYARRVEQIKAGEEAG